MSASRYSRRSARGTGAIRYESDYAVPPALESRGVGDLGLDDLIAECPPGATMRLTIIELSLPPSVGALREPPQLSISGDDADLDARGRLDAFVAQHGPMCRKESEWAADLCDLDFSARELKRACREGVIAWEAKAGGKDARARMIRSLDLQGYLNLRADVRAGNKPRPAWWSSVVMYSQGAA